MSMTKRALIIVGMQMDYCRGGAIAVEEGDRIVPVINRYIDGFTEAGGSIYVVRDIHPEETPHFKGSGGKWPPHCVKGTPGAEFPSNLKLAPESIIITKGLDPVEECSSAFEGTDENGQTLADSLRARGINHLYITGLATDYSVRATALDARRRGLAVTILIDAVRAVNEKIGDSEVSIREMRDAGADTRDLSNMVLLLKRSRPIRR